MLSTVLVDDEKLTIRALKYIIENHYPDIKVVGEANNGIMAYDLIESIRPDFAIVDIRMPHMDGVELMKKLNENQLDTRILVLSAYREFEYAREAISCGAYGYLVKPLSQDQLIEEIDKLKKEIEKEQSIVQIRHQLKSYLPHVKENLFRKLLDGTAGEEDIGKLEGDLSKLAKQQFYLILYRFEADSAAMELSRTEKISIPEDIQEKLKNRNLEAISFFQKEDELIVLIVDSERLADIGECIHLCTQTIEAYSSIPLCNTVTGKGLIASELRGNYQSAQKKLRVIKMAFTQLRKEEIKMSDLLIQKAKSYLEEHYAEPITLDSVSDHVAMHRNYFCSYFKDKTGENFWDYLTNLRIEKAKDMLAGTKLKMNEISEQVGYHNSSHFGHLFKTVVGMTPVEFRKRL